MSRARRKGEPPKVKEDPIDPFIRSLVGWKADREARLLVKLLGYGKRGAPASGLSPGEAKLLPKLRKSGMIDVEGRLVRLTRLGATVARGARKMYPEFWD